MLLSLLLAALPAVSPLGPSSPGVPGPQVGSVAPEPGLRGFLQRDGAPGLTLAELRGRVVVLHTFAWNCASCLRVGIPLAVDLQAAAEPRGLSVLSITTPAYRDETLEVLERFGVRHPVATEQPFGSENAYVDGMANPITYVYVIGRDGDLVWRGDPTTELEECLEALRFALESPAGRGLERPLHEELLEAQRLYFAGEWTGALRAAEKLERKHGRRDKGDSPAIAADARALIGRIEAQAEGLLAELRAGLDARDASTVASARRELARRLAKSDWEDRARELAEALAADAELAAAVLRADAWLALASERPALFPVREDDLTTRYAKRLRRYLEDEDALPVGRELAEAWLAGWDAAREERGGRRVAGRR